MDRCVEGFCRGAACYALRRKARIGERGNVERVSEHSSLCVGPVGAQHATPCAARRNLVIEDYLTKADG